jgi:hypothetical protein
MRAAKPANLSLDPALLRRARQPDPGELRVEQVMRAQRDDRSVSSRRRPLNTVLTALDRLS